MNIEYCETCGLPAAVTEQFWLESTDGDVSHIRVECFAGHARIMMGAAE